MSAPAVVDPAAPVIVEPQRAKYERSPILVFSLLVSALIILLALALGIAAKQTILDFHVAVLRLFAGLPDSVERFLIGLSQFAAVLLPILVVDRAARAPPAPGPARAGRGRRHQRDRRRLHRPRGQAREPRPRGHPGQDQRVARSAPPSPARPTSPPRRPARPSCGIFVGRRWGHAMWVAVAFVAAFRLLAGANVPLDIVIACAVGWFVGTAIGPGVRRARPPADRPRGRRRARRLRAARGAAGAGRGRRAGFDTVVRDHHRRQPDLREGVGPRRAGRRPAVPHLPLLPPEERRRSTPVLVAAAGRGARGAGRAQGPRLGHPHPARAQRGDGRAGRDAAGLRRHRGHLDRLDHGVRRRPPRPDLAAGGRPPPGAHRPPRPAPGQHLPGLRR